jgi:hypothetical protein
LWAVDDAVKLAQALGLFVLVGGCRLWYQPVPIASAIGKEWVVIAGDSFSVHRDPRFEIYGPRSQAVFDAYEQLNRTYRTFDRYFGAPMPRLAVILSLGNASRADTALDVALRSRGLTPLRYARPRTAVMRERLGTEGYEGALWPVGPNAARILLAALASPATSPATPVDTAAIAAFPAWFRAAVMRVVGDASALPLDIAFTREKRSSRWQVDRLVVMERFTAADSTLHPSRRAAADAIDRQFAAQASAFAQFLLDREGPDILNRLAHGYAARRTFDAMAQEFKTVPQSVAEIEERWLAWLAAQHPAY